MSSLPFEKMTLICPVSVLDNFTGVTSCRNCTPVSSIYFSILSEHSRSNPRRSILRTATVTSKPRPFKKPAHSRLIYEAPTQSVLPGLFSRKNTSSDDMARSPPSHSNGVGRPPTATKNRDAVIVLATPFLSVASMVCSSTNLANLLM